MPQTMDAPIQPHGGVLIDRLAQGAAREALLERALRAPGVSLSPLAHADLEMIASGAYSPLTGYMDRTAYTSVVETLHLPNGLPWTLPITLPVEPSAAESLRVGQDVALLDAQGQIVGLLALADLYTVDQRHEAQQVFRTIDPLHPGVARLMGQGSVYLAGDVWQFATSVPAFPALDLSPAALRLMFSRRGWRQIVAFQTRNPIHRAHEYLLKCAMEISDGLLLHPLVGETKDDDLPAAIRVESYRALIDTYFPPARVILGAFPAAMRYAGPREAVFHALCRKNYGCTHFIVGRDHAGVGSFYGSYDAQHIFREFDAAQIGIVPLFFEHAFYCRACAAVVTAKTCPHDSAQWLHLSGTQVREMLRRGEQLPAEFARPEVSRILSRGLAQPEHA